MTTMPTKFLVAAFIIIAAGSAAAQAPEAPVVVNTAGLAPHVAARVQEKAKLGQRALVRYLERTRTVHQLRIENLIVS